MARFTLIALLCTAMHCGSALAALSSRSDVAYGADTLTLDSVSGLEWLDPILTLGYTLNGTPNFLCDPNPCLSLTNALQVGGEFEGFHVASATEVSQLWANAGILNSNVERHPSLHPEGQAIVELGRLLGPAWRVGGSGSQWTIGVNTSTPWPNGSAGQVVARLLLFNDVPCCGDPMTTASTVLAHGQAISDSTYAMGFWLARPATVVPLPPAATLAFVPLGWLGFRRKTTSDSG